MAPIKKYRRRRRSTRRVTRPVKRYVRRAIISSEEKKYMIAYLPTTHGSISNAWVEHDVLATLAAGTDFTNRVGRDILVHNLLVKGTMFGGAQGSGFDDLYNSVRLLIFTTHRETAGSALTPLATAGMSINQPILKGNLASLGRIYRDMQIAITNSPISTSDGAPGHRAVNIFIRFKRGLRVHFTHSIAGYNQTQLWVSAISDSAAVPGPGFTIGCIRATFTDA